MPNGFVAILVAMAVTLGLAVAMGRIGGLRWRWLAAALALVLVHDALVTNVYGALPDLLGGERNWQGKLLALGATLAAAALPAIGWREAGLTAAQRPRSLGAAAPVALLYAAIFLGLALAFPDGEASREELAFQLTMPGLEEEAFSRGLLLLLFDRALPGRWRFLGADWGWGAVLTSLLFGLDHAMSYGAGGLSLEPLVLLVTALPSLVAVWLRYRTDSVLLPVLLHDWGNSAFLLL